MKTPQSSLWAGRVPNMAMPIVRGVVVATYFADQQLDREDEVKQRDPNFTGFEIKCVACDVLTYGPRRAMLLRVPVAQQRHALNDYTGLWIPRAASRDMRTGGGAIRSKVEGSIVSDPKDLDGDHVLVEFLENDPAQPFIRSQLPHPRAQYRQLAAASDAHESRFRGVTTRIDKDGNVVVDTTKANSGGINATTGAETAAADSTHGKVTVNVNKNAETVIQGVDINGANPTYSLKLKPSGELEVKLNNGATLVLTGNGGSTVTTIGDGAKHVAIVEALKALYGDAATVGSIANFLATHVHSDGFGSTGPPTTPTTPLWDPGIESTRVKIPNG